MHSTRLPSSLCNPLLDSHVEVLYSGPAGGLFWGFDLGVFIPLQNWAPKGLAAKSLSQIVQLRHQNQYCYPTIILETTSKGVYKLMWKTFFSYGNIYRELFTMTVAEILCSPAVCMTAWPSAAVSLPSPATHLRAAAPSRVVFCIWLEWHFYKYRQDICQSVLILSNYVQQGLMLRQLGFWQFSWFTHRRWVCYLPVVSEYK